MDETSKRTVQGVHDIQIEHINEHLKAALPGQINQRNAEIYHEALRKYPDDESIDKDEERRLRRKLDVRIIPLLGICYFFYVRLPP